MYHLSIYNFKTHKVLLYLCNIMELRNSESSERYVHVTQSSHERHVHVT